MQVKTLSSSGSGASLALIFEDGDEVISTLERFAEERRIGAAQFTAIGAFRQAVLGWFDPDASAYRKIPIDEQVEVLVLAGDIAREDEREKVHAHVVVGKCDGTAHGGHLLSAVVFPTLELILNESPSEMQRKHDPKTGLALIDFQNEAGHTAP